MKIPQFLYNENEDDYIELLETTFGKEEIAKHSPNSLHNIIFELSPTHIITTNYDPYIERSDAQKYYTMIASDKDLLQSGKEAGKLIIKMHGDYNDLQHIVLKEND